MSNSAPDPLSADPGRNINPLELQTNYIAVFDDHTAIVAGNGQLIGPKGINDMPVSTASTP